MKISQEDIDRANMVNLPIFLMENGFNLKKSGREYIWKEHDSLFIKDNAVGERGEWYRFSEHHGGDNISFVREYMNKSFIEAVEMLNGEIYDRSFKPISENISHEKNNIPSEIRLNENPDCKRVIAYLCKTRGLDYQLVSGLVKSGKIAQEANFGNVLFKYFDESGKLVGAEKCGTSTDKKFKGIEKGSSDEYGFEIIRGKGENALFFESAIDMLSYLQIHSSELPNHRLISMMGVKPEIVFSVMKRNGIPPENVYLCSDNDKAGNDFADRLRQEYPEMKRIVTPDNYKDWNDLLREIEIKRKQKEVKNLIEYGNKTWNDATDNKDKTLITMNEQQFRQMREKLDNSGINFFSYIKNNTAVMAVNDSDIKYMQQILGQDLQTKKSQVPYTPPQKNIIGTAVYRYIPDKTFISSDRDTALKTAHLMEQQNMQFSGVVYNNGKATLTVSCADYEKANRLMQSVIEMRKKFAPRQQQSEIIGNKNYRDIHEKSYFYTRITPEKYKEIKPFLDSNSIKYSGLIRDGKVTFTVEKSDSAAFHNALETALKEVQMIKDLQNMHLDSSQMMKLDSVIHRLSEKNAAIQLDNFFDSRFNEMQFDEMLSLVEDYLETGNNSVLSDMINLKNQFDSEFIPHEEIQENDNILQNDSLKKPELTELEKAFMHGDILPFMAKSVLSWDEIEDIGYWLFEENYTDRHKPSEKAIFGNGMPEMKLYDLALKMNHDGEDIRKELALGLLGSQKEFTTTHDNTFQVEYGENSLTATYGNAEREINYEELGQAFINLIKGEHEEIVHDRTIQDLQDEIPKLYAETAEQLIRTFDEVKNADWKTDTQNKREIKSALYDILNDEEYAEKAFKSIADMKYNFKEGELPKIENKEKFTLRVDRTSDAFDSPYCISKIDSNGDFIDYYEESDGYIPTFDTISETLEYAENNNLDVENFLEEIPENRLYTLQDAVDRYFGTDCKQAETDDNSWKISVTDDEKVSEVFHNGTAVCGIYNQGDKMLIEPYDEPGNAPELVAEAILKHNPAKSVEIKEKQESKIIENPQVDEDTPLFSDSAVIQKIQESEESDNFQPDITGEQLTLFGGSESIKPKKSTKEEYSEELFVGGINRFTALHDDIMRGTGFQNGKFRVQEFYQKNNPTNAQLAEFLKKEYGTGGHSGNDNISLVDYDSKGMAFRLETGEKFKFTWSDVAEMVSATIDKGEYITQQDIEIGDKFKNKVSGEVCEVISLTGALPFYTDQCTVSKKSGAFEITENIGKNDLLNTEKYERVTEAEKAIEVPDEPKKDFHITDDSLGEGGQKSKFQANIRAIQTLKVLEKENRPATDEEKETLSKYVGWGGIAQAFDENNSAWTSEYQELKSLLTPQEYTSARASTLDAFYTSPTVINSIYEALKNFGFEGGNVLEPAMGVGNFFGCMPEEIRKDSKLYGVEIDSISGRIAQKIYPDADIVIQGFEKNSFQNGCFDVAVGNVPFGDLGFKDEVHNTNKLHDYFFVETMDKLKNGGIMAFVTSAGTLDKHDESVRQMLADKADLIGAVRLPNTAFKQNANTEVTADIIFLQKHEGKSVAEMSDIPDWVHIGQTEDGLPINKYFEQNPDMILGKVVEGNKLYGKSGTMVIPFENSDLKTQLHEAVSKLSAKINDERPRDVYSKTEHATVKIPSDLRNYSFFEHDNNIYFKQNKNACEFRFDKTNSQHKRFKAFIELRDITRELLNAQEFDKPDSVIKDLQQKLNVAYDDFYKKYGLIHSQSNKRYFGEDVSYNLVAGLEKKFDKTKLIEKSDIFTQRTIQPPKAVEHVETAQEALTLSIAEKARVDFEYMGHLTGMTEDELKRDLTGEIFKVPHTENTYQTASEYLSGDIRQKLNIAEEVAEYDSDFNINVNALKQAMPEPLKAGDIDVKIGAAWIDPKYYEQFIYELFQTPAYQRTDSPAARWNKNGTISCEYSEHTGTWHINRKSSDKSVLTTQKFGSPKMNAYEIMEHMLNLKDPKIYKTVEVPDGMGDTKEKRVVDIDATRVVQRKADTIRSEFKKWIFRDSERREDIVNKYNELFNSIRPREYDGSHLTFPMMNKNITLHEHQKNAVAHALFGGNTLFAHCVGAGKSFEMIATAMESKRLGLCTKSLFAVPNHLTEQIGDDFMKLYPSANILVATKNDFKKENRQQLFAKIATGNFDAVIIGHSQLGMIPVSKERQQNLIQSQIDDILLGIEELKKSDGSKFQIKAMERTRKSLQKQLEKLEKNHDDTVTFEQLGIDHLFVDEAHECTTRS